MTDYELFETPEESDERPEENETDSVEVILGLAPKVAKQRPRKAAATESATKLNSNMSNASRKHHQRLVNSLAKILNEKREVVKQPNDSVSKEQQAGLSSQSKVLEMLTAGKQLKSNSESQSRRIHTVFGVPLSLMNCLNEFIKSVPDVQFNRKDRKKYTSQSSLCDRKRNKGSKTKIKF